MSPYARMAQKYADNPQERPFSYYVVWHMMHGFCFSTPEFFIMGRLATKRFIEENPIQFLWNAKPNDPDTWYVHAASGDLSKAWSILPYPLPWLAFERLRNGKLELQILPLSRIRRLTEITST